MNHPRTFAKIADVRVGSKLETDGGFTCMEKGHIKIVRQNKKGELFVYCRDGEHYLGWQADDGDIYIGLYAVPE